MTSQAKAGYSVPTSSATTWIFVLFCMINMLNFMDRGIIPGAPTQFQYFIKETMNISIGDESKYLGLLASSFIASYAGFILLFGYLSIFMKPFHLVAAGLSVWCIAVLICGAAKPANSFYLLLAGRIISGIGESSFQCIAPPFIDDHAPPALRTLWLGIFFSCISVGTAVGYEYGALLSNSSWGWGWAFNLEAMLMSPLILCCIFAIPAVYNRAGEHHHHHIPLPTEDVESDPNTIDEEDDDDVKLVSPRKRQSFIQEAWLVCNNAVFMLTALGTAAFTFSLAGLSVFGPMFLIGLGLFEKETEASMVFGSVIVLSGLIGTPLGGLVLDWSCRQKPHLRQFIALRQVFIAMTIGTSLAILAWTMLPNKEWFLFTFGLALCFLFATTSSNAIVILLCVDPSRRSLAVGVNTLILHLFGDVPSPIILGALKDAWAPDCGSIELDGKVVLNPDCAHDFQGLLASLLFPLLWMIWSVISYGAAAWLVQRRLRAEGHNCEDSMNESVESPFMWTEVWSTSTRMYLRHELVEQLAMIFNYDWANYNILDQSNAFYSEIRSTSMAKENVTLLLLKGALEVVIVLVYCIPQYISQGRIHDIELFRFIFSTIATCIASCITWNVGVVAFLHVIIHVISNVFGSKGGWYDNILFLLRIGTLERLVGSILFHRISYEKRFQANKKKLEQFYQQHDPSRIHEAESLLLEYIGNEQLLFIKLTQRYLSASSQETTIHDTTQEKVILKNQS